MNLWETEEGSAVMHYLVDRFITTTATVNSLPIILFIPRPDTMGGSDAPQYTQFRKQIQRRHSDLAIVDLMDHEFDKERFHVQPYEGHASAYGNQVIAHVIEKTYRKINEQCKLVTASRPNGIKLSASSP